MGFSSSFFDSIWEHVHIVYWDFEVVILFEILVVTIIIVIIITIRVLRVDFILCVIIIIIIIFLFISVDLTDDKYVAAVVPTTGLFSEPWQGLYLL